jgi:hypothetical protein
LTFLAPENTSGEAELFPALWQVLEALVSADAEQRGSALEALQASKAVRLSGLVAYLISTRITEPNLALRGTVLELLNEALTPDEHERMPAEEVRAALRGNLSNLGQERVLALLEIAQYRTDVKAMIARVLNQCSTAGEALTEILNDRYQPLAVREQAALFIGEVGYTDAQHSIERLVNRLESRQGNQQSMAFAPASANDEGALIPVLHSILQRFDAPA